jgi:hypothetical protein
MNTFGRIATVVIAAALLGAAVAVPATAATDGGGDETDTQTERAGPPTDLPGPVPGFVERLLGAIEEFVTDRPVAGTVG